MDEPVDICQIELVVSLGLLLGEQFGVTTLSVRQMNAVVRAADIIVDAFAPPDRGRLTEAERQALLAVFDPKK